MLPATEDHATVERLIAKMDVEPLFDGAVYVPVIGLQFRDCAQVAHLLKNLVYLWEIP